MSLFEERLARIMKTAKEVDVHRFNKQTGAYCQVVMLDSGLEYASGDKSGGNGTSYTQIRLHKDPQTNVWRKIQDKSSKGLGMDRITTLVGKPLASISDDEMSSAVENMIQEDTAKYQLT
jgi:hypothetical protein